MTHGYLHSEAALSLTIHIPILIIAINLLTEFQVNALNSHGDMLWTMHITEKFKGQQLCE